MQQKSLGLIETQGLAAGVVAADAAVKSANVELVGYELTKGGGWTLIKVQGDVGAVKAAVDAARIAAGKVNRVVSTRVIARPSNSLEQLIHTADTVGDQRPEPPEGPEPPHTPTPPTEPETPAEPESPAEPEASEEAPEEPGEPEEPEPPAEPENPAEPETPEEVQEEAAEQPQVEQAQEETVPPAEAEPSEPAPKPGPEVQTGSSSRRSRKSRNKSNQSK